MLGGLFPLRCGRWPARRVRAFPCLGHSCLIYQARLLITCRARARSRALARSSWVFPGRRACAPLSLAALSWFVAGALVRGVGLLFLRCAAFLPPSPPSYLVPPLLLGLPAVYPNQLSIAKVWTLLAPGAGDCITAPGLGPKGDSEDPGRLISQESC